MLRIKKVLVVDDEPILVRILVIKLKLSVYEVVTALDGQQALELVQSCQPNIMLLDIIMPVMDGFQVLERLRTFSNMPVIVFSAKLENAQKALSLGANDFLTKPFDVNDLVTRIQRLVGSNHH